MMETGRKRPLEGDEVVSSKKRVTSSGGVQVQINGKETSDSEIPADENLEAYRKLAIYRKMKQYARACERAEQTVADLQKTRASYAAGIAAMEACWKLLVDKLRTLVSLTGVEPKATNSYNLYDMAINESLDSELSNALQEQSRETEELFKAARLSSTTESNSSVMVGKCELLQAENTAIHAQMNLLRTRLSDSTEALERTRERLELVENRLERVRSEAQSSQASRSPTISAKELLESAVKRETPVPESSNGSSNQKQADEMTNLQSLLEAREAHIKELTEQISQLTASNHSYKDQFIDPSEEMLSRSSLYKASLDQAALSMAQASDLMARVQRLQAENEELRIGRHEYEEQLKTDSKSTVEEYKVQLVKRDIDLNRIRENRDSLQAELHDKKALLQAQSDGQKFAKGLASARYERIKVLNKEVNRLRLRLAANARDEDLLQFLLSEDGAEGMLSERILKVNRDLQTRLDATEAVLSQAVNPSDLLSKVDEKVKIIELETKVRHYESMIGTSQDMSARLSSQMAELRDCRLALESKEQEIVSQQAALDQLATAWEILNEKVESKIVDTSVLEEKINKLASEKAKADNKYFATMRIKDQLELEKKTLMRTLEKQSKAIEKYVELESSLNIRIANQLKEIAHHEFAIHTCRDQIAKLENSQKQLQYQRDGLQAKLSEVSHSLSTQETEYREKAQSKRKIDEELMLAKKELERTKTKASATSISTEDKGTQQKLDICMRLLTCSTCKENFRDRLLSKCLHTFCHKCLDARVATRQRKCPACNLTFAISDVQNLYFQG